ncbi:hypothetical protein NQ318_016613 [Aromia moschata]|uniref:Uncharacterized protein n=1 Tax=Aromia moschata TaxID=1265417 RepID=A0AAV8XM72_9CUCU|nr:hypothetical protein NQ318_016613 [Aromia moschata]
MYELSQAVPFRAQPVLMLEPLQPTTEALNASGFIGCIQLKHLSNHLNESLKIEILMMIGYGDRARTQCEVVRLFRETHPDLPPLNQGTISKIEAQYREMGHVRKVPSKRQAVVDDDTKLNLLLALEENPITPARQLARDSNLNHKTVLKILKYEKKRPYKMQAVQELLEDDPDDDKLQILHHWILWGHLKSGVFFQTPNNIADLQKRIREEIGKITPQMLHNVRDETYHRLGCCQQCVCSRRSRIKTNQAEAYGRTTVAATCASVVFIVLLLMILWDAILHAVEKEFS